MINQRFDTPSPVRLDLRLPVANAEITTTDKPESTVVVTGPQRMLDATKVELDGDRLLVEIQRKLFGGFGHRFNGEQLRVEITVPARSRVEIASAAGDGVLDGTFDRVVVKSASGALTATGEILGDAVIQTVSGNIRLPRVGGDLRAASVSGNVAAGEVGGSVVAKSVSGDIRIASVREGRVEVQSVSGNVEVGIAGGTNLDVDASTASGTLSSEVPLSGTRNAKQGPTVVVRGKTVSGDVRLYRAA